MATTCWAVWLFWLSLTAVIYPYAIYPLLLAAWKIAPALAAGDMAR